MCGCFMVIKLFMLKILLDGLTGFIAATRYNYNYHPSAEEYDNLLSETRRYWTHTIPKSARDKLFLSSTPFKKPAKPAENRAVLESRYFVPKFQYKSNEVTKFKDDKVKPLTNIQSSVEFNYFSNELPNPLFTTTKKLQPTLQPSTPLKYNLTNIPVKPLAKPLSLNKPANSFTNLKRINTTESLPIYFTNPATGIVYAIQELGQSYQNFSKTNGTIPIFITKEQHERDMFQLKNNYEQKCKDLRVHHATPTTSIVRIQKPAASIKPITTSAQLTTGSTDIPKPLKKPQPVVVKAELIVKDKTPPTPLRPLRKKKTKPKPKTTKLNIKKQKPPGHKVLRTTLRPVLANLSEGPAIILGTRTLTKPSTINENVPTQLEKPNFENIFSAAAAHQQTEQHHLSKRSIEKDYETPNHRSDLKNKNISHKSLRNFVKNASNNLKNASPTAEKSDQKLPLNKKQILEKLAKILLKNLPHKNTFKHRNTGATAIMNFKPQLRAENLRNSFTKKNKTFSNSIKNFQTKNSETPKSFLKHQEPFSKVNSPKTYKSWHQSLNNKENIPNVGKRNVTTSLLEHQFELEPNQILKPSGNSNSNNGFKSLKVSQITTNRQHKLNISKSAVKNTTAKENKLENAKNLSSLKNSLNNQQQTETETTTQNDANKLKWNFFSIKTNNRNHLHIEKENDEQSLAKKSYKTKLAGNFNLKKFKHHINKRSTTALNKLNRTLPKLNKMPHKFLNISKSQINRKNSSDFEINKQRLDQTTLNNKTLLTNSTATTKKSNNTAVQNHKKKTKKHLKQRKRWAKIKGTQSPGRLVTSPRAHKKIIKSKKKIQKKTQGKQEADYYIFDMEESYEEDDAEDDGGGEDDSEEEEEYADDEEDDELQDEAADYHQQNEILAYDDEPLATHTSEAGLSIEEFNEKPSIEKVHDSEMLEVVSKPDTDTNEVGLKTKISYVKKRFRRRPPLLETNTDYDYDDEDEDEDDEDNSVTSNLGGFFRMIFYPLHMAMSSIMESLSGKDNSDDDHLPHTQYTSYHKTLKQPPQYSNEYYEEDDDDDDDNDEYDANESGSSALGSWFSSWFGFNRRNKKIGSTTVAPIKLKPTKTSSSSWLPSWLTFGANDRISTETDANEDYSEYDKWFASWFGEMKPKARKRTTTTTTTTTTQLPQVPILTIVDPMKNPQNWIGILAHHIINQTSTVNPLKDIWNKVTTATTENPETSKRSSYDKYQIWRLKPQDDGQVKALEEYKKSEDGLKLQWLKGPSLRGLNDVLVPPKMLVDFQASLTFELIDHEVLIFDVGKAIAYEKSKENYFFTTTQKPKKQQIKNPAPITGMTWHKYYEYDDIIKYLETMRMRFPHLVELIHIGRSYEGRPLIVTKIESREAAAINSAHYTAHKVNKLRHKKRIGLANAVFIEAGTHGLEWIGPATATWIINELLRIMKKNTSDEQSFIRNTTWYILPVLNPDGYVYSHEFDRFWKKSRSRHIARPSGILNSAMTWLQKKRAKEKVCFGVDLDRNWHYQWGRRGSSKSACNEFYAGPTPFSEPETKAVAEFLMDYRTQIKLFVSMQSYGQIISYPYKANTTYDSERLEDLLDVAMVGTDGLRKKGSKSRYKIDSSNDLIENRSGCSDAFAAYEVGIPFSYTLQLADNGVHGYLLPSASIESTARDSFDIIKGMLDYI